MISFCYTAFMSDRSKEMYEFNNSLDEIRTLIYKVLDFEKDEYSEKKDMAKRELRFAINDLLNQTDNL